MGIPPANPPTDPPATSPTLVPLGVVVGAHGVHGGLKVRLFNPASDLLESRGEAWLRHAGETRRVQLKRAKRDARGLLVKLEGTTTRDAAEHLRGAELCAARDELPPLEDGEVYLVDLEGLSVRTPDGTDAGVVEGTIVYPSVTALRVRSDAGTREVPMLARYVLETNVEQGVIVVDHLDEIDVLRDRGTR